MSCMQLLYNSWPQPDIKLFGRMYSHLTAASDWPRSFFTPKVFLFSIYIYGTAQTQLYPREHNTRECKVINFRVILCEFSSVKKLLVRVEHEQSNKHWNVARYVQPSSTTHYRVFIIFITTGMQFGTAKPHCISACSRVN